MEKERITLHTHMYDSYRHNTYIPLSNGAMGSWPSPGPEDNPDGRWCCSVDRDEGENLFSFLEVHESGTWHSPEKAGDPSSRKVVFRISLYDGFDERVQLGMGAILDRKQISQLHARLGELLKDMG